LIYLALHAARTSRSMLTASWCHLYRHRSLVILAGLSHHGNARQGSGTFRRGSLWSMIFVRLKPPISGLCRQLSSPAVGGAAITRSVVWSPGGAHNGWIELTTQLGFIGLALWAVVFLRTAGLATRLSLDRNQGGNPGALWPALMLIVVTTWSLVESISCGMAPFICIRAETGYLLHLDTEQPNDCEMRPWRRERRRRDTASRS
jgi:hypothetical protein